VKRAIGLLLFLSVTAAADGFDYQKLNGLYGFDWLHLRPRDHCVKVDAKRMRELKSYTCAVPDEGSSSGKVIRFKCQSKDNKREYLLFATSADCTDEIESQKANAD
jgi:hypothetical protein